MRLSPSRAHRILSAVLTSGGHMNPQQGPHAPSHAPSQGPARSPAQGGAGGSHSPTPIQPRPAVSSKVTGVLNAPVPTYDRHDDPIDLVDEMPVNATVSKPSIQPLSKIQVQGHNQQQRTFARKTDVSGHGALRVRSFHGRLSDEGLIYMDSKINEWLDQHPEIEIKQATTCVGEYEGKIREPALIVNIWY